MLNDAQLKVGDFILGLDAKSIQALLEDPAAKALLDRPGFYVRANMLRRWAELDPHRALSWATSHEFPDKASAVGGLYAAWSVDDPKAAFAALTQVKGSIHAKALAEVIRNYCDQDPAAAFAALNSLPLIQTNSLYAEVFGTWITKDSAAAVAAAVKLPPGTMRDETWEAIASNWSLIDSAAAMTWINTWPAGAAKDHAVVNVLQTMCDQDAANVAASLANYNIPAGESRDELLYVIATHFAEQDPAGALAWADKNLVGRDFVGATASALQQISTTDPAAAAAYLANITDPDVLHYALPKIMENWGNQDPEAALAWAQALPGDNVALRNDAITSVFSSWIAADPASAGSYIQQNFADDPSFKTLTGDVVTKWADADPQGAFTWALSLPVGVNGARINAITTALTALTNVDPQTAMQDALMLSGNNQLSAETAVISAWANQNPAQAAASLQNLPAGKSLDTATGNVAKSWLTQDPQAASQWINTLSPGSARDAAVAQIISTVGENNPADAFNWAITIDNQTTRNTQIVKLASQWSKQNPAAAAAAAQNALQNLTGLTAEQQAALQKVIGKAPVP